MKEPGSDSTRTTRNIFVRHLLGYLTPIATGLPSTAAFSRTIQRSRYRTYPMAIDSLVIPGEHTITLVICLLFCCTIDYLHIYKQMQI